MRKIDSVCVCEMSSYKKEKDNILIGRNKMTERDKQTKTYIQIYSTNKRKKMSFKSKARPQRRCVINPFLLLVFFFPSFKNRLMVFFCSL